ncbi:capsular biosynthesis protein CpsH [Lacticaseibacillus suibinensis]|uniref:capsular biosynthesis protein CpsH n=1 Tax=Lacticaseibacillus suibinensis TaxID=2486011 RepID=UPI001944E8DC|nr:capsular biosynthesis protein CpsH [Lacticaseibacillus suibinensis]
MDELNLDRFRGKNVLLVSPNFFQYVAEISAAFDKYGIKHTYLNDRANTGFLWKLIARYLPKLNEKFVAQKLEELCQEQAFDYLLIIKGESVSPQMLKRFKQYNPNAPVYLYLWDSIKNSGHAIKYQSQYTKVFTFDNDDAQHYKIQLLPLFVGMQYQPSPRTQGFDYDMMFVGTAHSIRSKVLNEIEQTAAQEHLRFFDFRFVQNRLIYVFRYLTNPDFRKTPKALIHLDQISGAEVQQVFTKSKVVVDVTHPEQSGLTGRVVEALSIGRKVVTTNPRVLDYEVVDPQDVLLWPAQKDELTRQFIDTGYHGDPGRVYAFFSVETWLSTILTN